MSGPRVAFVSHVIGLPLSVLAQFPKRGGTAEPSRVTLTIQDGGRTSVPLLTPAHLLTIENEAWAHALDHSRAAYV